MPKYCYITRKKDDDIVVKSTMPTIEQIRAQVSRGTINTESLNVFNNPSRCKFDRSDSGFLVPIERYPFADLNDAFEASLSARSKMRDYTVEQATYAKRNMHAREQRQLKDNK